MANANIPGKFYLIAAMYAPTEAERITGAKKKVVVEPRFVVADDDQAAHNQTILLVPRDIEIDPDRLEVFIALPFGR